MSIRGRTHQFKPGSNFGIEGGPGVHSVRVTVRNGRAAAALAVVLVGAACGDDRLRDASIDVTPVPADAAGDARADGQVDGLPDATIDANADGAMDAMVDGRADAPVDAHADAAPDAAPDATIVAGFTFAQAQYDIGVVPANVATLTPPPVIELTNGSSMTQSATFQTAPPFAVAGSDCTDVPPTTTCRVRLQVIASATGPIGGTLTAVAPGGTSQASLAGVADGAIEWITDGSGAGTITTDVAAEGCGGECFPGGAAVTGTATPGTGSHFVGWSDPACGAAMTCTEVAGDFPQSVTATFDLDQVTFAVDFTGDGSGEVAIRSYVDFTTVVCAASCSTTVPYGAVELQAATADRFDGFSAPCPAASYECSVPAGTASVTVTFARELGQVDLIVDGAVLSVDYDGAGDLVVGTTASVTKLSPSLAVVWTAAIPGVARVDDAGEVFVLGADGLHALDANGTERWHGGAGWTPVARHLGHTFAPMPGGGVVVDRDGALELWNGGGSIVATPVLGAPDYHAIAVDSSGHIFAAVMDLTDRESTDLEVFDPSGVRLPDFGNLVPEYVPAMRVDSSDHVVASCSGHSHLWVRRVDLAGAEDFLDTTTIDDGDFMANGVAADGANDVVSLRSWDEYTAPAEGMLLRKLSPIGSVVWSLARPGFAGVDWGPFGLAIVDVAASADGHVAVGGRYVGMTATRGIVEIFP